MLKIKAEVHNQQNFKQTLNVTNISPASTGTRTVCPSSTPESYRKDKNWLIHENNAKKNVSGLGNDSLRQQVA